MSDVSPTPICGHKASRKVGCGGWESVLAVPFQFTGNLVGDARSIIAKKGGKSAQCTGGTLLTTAGHVNQGRDIAPRSTPRNATTTVTRNKQNAPTVRPPILSHSLCTARLCVGVNKRSTAGDVKERAFWWNDKRQKMTSKYVHVQGHGQFVHKIIINKVTQLRITLRNSVSWKRNSPSPFDVSYDSL